MSGARPPIIFTQKATIAVARETLLSGCVAIIYDNAVNAARSCVLPVIIFFSVQNLSIIEYIRIINQTKQQILSLNAKNAQTFFDKVIGLIGKDKSTSMIFQTRFGIHTFGIKFPIDIIVLNKQNVVISLRKNLKPFRFFFWNPRYDTIVELPAGIIDLTKTESGDHLKFEFEN